MQKFNTRYAFFAGLLIISGCSVAPKYHIVKQIDNLPQLETLHAISTKRNTHENARLLRTNMLKEIGLSLGAQAGLAARAKTISQIQEKTSAQLDQIFNFNGLLLAHNVVPPVLTQAENTLNLTDAQTLRISDRTYQIVSQAHFVSTPPHWHDYLKLNYTFPEKPAMGFLPKNTEERAIWREAVRTGWQNGILQANAINAANLSRLKRDYLGMVLYRKLLKQGMLSEPYVARIDLGVTGDSSKLNIHDQVLRITALPALQTATAHWKPVITSDESTTAQ